MEYKPKGVCSRLIHFDIVDNKVRNVSFVGGCSGNLQGISHLIEGMMRRSRALKASGADSNRPLVRISLPLH
jgi:uncharacterized protein (TIGR03905 family)